MEAVSFLKMKVFIINYKEIFFIHKPRGGGGNGGGIMRGRSYKKKTYIWIFVIDK